MLSINMDVSAKIVGPLTRTTTSHLTDEKLPVPKKCHRGLTTDRRVWKLTQKAAKAKWHKLKIAYWRYERVSAGLATARHPQRHASAEW